MSERARQAFLRRTSIGPAALDRLRARLGVAIRARPELREAAARVTAADPEVVARIHSRMGRRRRVPVGWLALAAAAAVLGLAVVVPRWLPDPPLAPDATIEHVELAFHGEGRVGGTRHAPRIDWQEGTLSVRVTPHEGVDLTVATPEATAEVVGTVFEVRRENHATGVGVTEGTVRVTCAGAAEALVHAGEERTCLPADPSTLLLRAAELTRAGAAPSERLATVDRGLAGAAEGTAVRAELLAQRARALVEAGAADEALAAAEAYLATGEVARRAELVSFVARTRYDREACGAVPALERAAIELPPGPEGVLLARCIVDREPARALALLADLSWADPAWREVAERLRAQASR